MAVDSRQQSHLSGMSYGYAAPPFTNPWGNNPAVSSGAYATTQAPTSLDSQSQLQHRNLTLPPYNGLSVATTTLGSGPSLLAIAYGHPSNVTQSQYPQYTTSGPNDYQSVTAPSFLSLPDNRAAGFAFAPNDARRPSHSFNSATQAHRESFGDVVDANRQILSLNQNDVTPTPRNMYGDQTTRSSPESYGFPPTHSAHSSISSASGVHSSYGSSLGDYPLTDYSSASESVDMNHRTLPRPSGSMQGSNAPPAPQSMMGQFSSKVSSSTQKKHKCKVCDKRFTRPSSLQTHIYSHTGEKPFACEVDGCGRHFSVVSNLRRHKKVHKNQHDSGDANSPEESGTM